MSDKEYLDLNTTFKILLRNKKLVLGGAFGFSVLVAIASLFLKNEFKSIAKFYAVNSMQLHPKVIYGEDAFALYGDSKETDRMVTIATSYAVKDFIVNKYNLMEHYEIDTTKLDRITRLDKKYQSKITVNNTDRGAIEITVYDTDAKIAANIANDILLKTNFLCVENVKSTVRESMKIHENTMQITQSQLIKLQDSLTKTSQEYGIVLSSSEEGASSMKALKGWEKFSEGIDLVTGMKAKIAALNKSYSESFDEFTKAKQTLESEQNALMVVEHAREADRKTRPMRSLIVIGGFFAAALLLSLYVLLKDYYLSKLK